MLCILYSAVTTMADGKKRGCIATKFVNETTFSKVIPKGPHFDSDDWWFNEHYDCFCNTQSCILLPVERHGDGLAEGLSLSAECSSDIFSILLCINVQDSGHSEKSSKQTYKRILIKRLKTLNLVENLWRQPSPWFKWLCFNLYEGSRWI